MISYTNFLQQVKIEKRGQDIFIFCLIRKKWLVSTPEEMVRQAALLYLVELGYSTSHITVERLVKVNTLSRRYDIVVSNKQGRIIILVECKAPQISISQDALDQAGTYNMSLKAGHIWITNGHTNFAFQIDHQKKVCTVIDSLPLPNQKIDTKMSQSSEGNDIKDWSYDKFLCFVLLYASYADYDFSEDERTHILTYVDQTILEDVEAVFNKLGDYEQLDLILTLKKKYITSSEDKEQLLGLLRKQFDIDGDYSRLEGVLYQFLEKLL